MKTAASLLLLACLALCGCLMIPVTRTRHFISLSVKSSAAPEKLAYESVRAAALRLGYVESEPRSQKLPVIPLTVDEEERRRRGRRYTFVAFFEGASNQGKFHIRVDRVLGAAGGYRVTVFRYPYDESTLALAERKRLYSLLAADERLRNVTLGQEKYRDVIDLIPLAP